MTKTKCIQSTNNDYKYDIVDSLSCKSQFVIYLLECRACGMQYVGQTSNNLATRMTQQLSDVRTHKDTSVASHFNQENHEPRDLRCSAICATSRNINTCLRHEEAWICLLATTAPNGLNVMS